MFFEISCSIKERNLRGVKNCIKSLLPPRLVSNIVFYKHHHRLIDRNNPLLMDEKLLILKDGLYKKNDLVTKCTDKFAVRQYLESLGLQDILVKLIAVYNTPQQICWSDLPEKFAIKCNHGSGYNIIVTDAKTINIEKATIQLEKWFRQDYSVISAEAHYHGIPRKIVVEEFIETESGIFPNDYKFFASRGKVICSLVISGRGGKQERIYVDKNFQDLKLVNEYRGGV